MLVKTFYRFVPFYTYLIGVRKHSSMRTFGIFKTDQRLHDNWIFQISSGDWLCEVLYHCMHVAPCPWCVQCMPTPLHSREKSFSCETSSEVKRASQVPDCCALDGPAERWCSSASGSFLHNCSSVKPLPPKVRPSRVGPSETPGRHVPSAEEPLTLSFWGSSIDPMGFV